jgi:hypothetical protein
VASGSDQPPADQPPAGPPRLADSLVRHRWVAAAGMTATIAVVAGGGLALALHDSSSGPPKECGLVPCAAALPASVQTSRAGSASAPAATAPTAAQRAATPPEPPGPAYSPTSPAASAPARGTAPPGTAPPGTAPPEAVPPEAAPPADRPASAEPVSIPEPGASCTTVIAFTARGTMSTPVRCTFTDAVRQQRTGGGSGHPGSRAAGQDGDRAGGQLRQARSKHYAWQASWLSDWLSRGWSHRGSWSGGGWSGSGRWGQHGGG